MNRYLLWCVYIVTAIIISPNTFNQLIYLTTGFRFLAHKKY